MFSILKQKQIVVLLERMGVGQGPVFMEIKKKKKTIKGSEVRTVSGWGGKKRKNEHRDRDCCLLKGQRGRGEKGADFFFRCF